MERSDRKIRDKIESCYGEASQSRISPIAKGVSPKRPARRGRFCIGLAKRHKKARCSLSLACFCECAAFDGELNLVVVVDFDVFHLHFLVVPTLHDLAFALGEVRGEFEDDTSVETEVCLDL